MKMLSITINTIKLTFKNKTVFFMQILFPIVLIFVFGIILNGTMNKSKNFKDVKIGYYSAENKDMNNEFNEIKRQGIKLGIKFYEEKKESGIKKVEDGKYTCFIEIKNSEINMYKSDKDEFKTSLVESLMKTFIQRYNAIFKIASVNPKALGNINLKSINMSLVNDISINGKGAPGSMDYYAVTMLTYIMMFSLLNGFTTMSKRKQITNRIICSPVRNSDVICGKILGDIVFSAMQILILILFSKFVFKAYFGEHILAVFLIVLAEAAVAISIGISIGLMDKNYDEINTQFVAVSMVIGFLGGSYFPVKYMGKTFQMVANISPIKLINDAVFNVIYENNFVMAFRAIGICSVVCIIFIIITSIFYERRVF